MLSCFEFWSASLVVDITAFDSVDAMAVRFVDSFDVVVIGSARECLLI